MLLLKRFHIGCVIGLRTFVTANTTVQGLNTKTKGVCITLQISSIAECITLAALICHWHLSRLEQMPPKESEMCIPMHKSIIVTNENNHRMCPEGLKEVISNKTEETKSCCGPTSVILKEMSAKVVQNKYDSDAAPELAALDIKEFNCFVNKTSPLKANLVGLSSDKQPEQTKSSSKLFWNTGLPSFTDSGLKYLVDNGTIYLEKSGYFYISSQLRLKIQNTNCTDGVSCNRYKHFIKRISKAREEQVLLEVGKSFCKTASDVFEFTSAIGAVFKLEGEDQLYVTTSHSSSVLSDLSDNYFSIYSV